jgi:hypothetical protein
MDTLAHLEIQQPGLPAENPIVARAFDDSHLHHCGAILPKLYLNNDSLKHSFC